MDSTRRGLYKGEERKSMATERRLQYLSDSELVEIARMGSLEACDEIVRRFRGAVILVAAQALGGCGSAEDVAQETFLIAFRSLSQLREPAKFPGWLSAIARHRARRVASGEQRHRPVDLNDMDRLHTEKFGSADPEEVLLTSEEFAKVHTGLNGLPPEQRIVLQLYYLEEWTAPRIAEFLSLPLTTVRWRLHSGLKRLRHRLSEIIEENYYGYE